MLAWLLLFPAWDPVDGFRSSVCAIGDVDRDGVSDILACARLSVGSEAVWLLSGADGSKLRTLDSPREGTMFGRALCALGDVDGDEVPDFAVGGNDDPGFFVHDDPDFCHWKARPHSCSDAAGAERGYARVYSGASGEVLFELTAQSHRTGFGTVLAGGRDLDGDTVPDLVVGNPPETVLLVSGATGEPYLVIESQIAPRLDSDWQWIWGQGLAVIDDVSGDDLSDVMMTGYESSWGTGGGSFETVLAVSGVSGEAIWKRRARLDSAYDGGGWQVALLEDGDGGDRAVLVAAVDDSVRLFSWKSQELIRAHEFRGGYMHAEGTTAGPVGDLDGDGIGDYAIGANEAEFAFDPGFVQVYSGSTGDILWRVSPTGHDLGGSLHRDEKPSAISSPTGDGLDFCAPGDLDGDETPDLIVFYRRQRKVAAISGKYSERVLWEAVIR